MIERYTLPRMQAVWDLRRKYEIWLEVELLACEALEKSGQVPRGVAAKIRRRAKIDPDRIAAIEKVTKHDVIAFLESLAEPVGKDARYLHTGLTSSDIVDTSLAVQMGEALDLILLDMEVLLSVLKKRAFEHRDTLMVGRSHGIHGEPVSFGFKLAIWYEETRRHRDRLRTVRKDIAVGKLSGAMGTFAHQGPEVEEYVCRKLGLQTDPVSNQIVQRDRHAAYASALALLAASIEKFATEIRHLQRTEVLEAEEFFAEGQKGSSAMPHKRNPIASENLCGLARVVRANSLAAMENVALWHERDISHSSVERVIMPDSTILIDYMLVRVTDLIRNLIVYPQRMKQNLEMTGGLVYSQRLLLALIEKGAQRKEAYEAVQRCAMSAWKGRAGFHDLVSKDPFITKRLTHAQIQSCFDPRYYLRHVDTIYRRVFGSGKGKKK
ncbi:MAG TPA: adenylosuccinate lyase [Nitrospiraceae bacterium]|nr:adenylosuccinate lyase [Nitrospiraceae bacterium]